MPAGEEKVWESLSALDPDDVCRRTGASYDAAPGLYALKSFGREFHISPRQKAIRCQSPDCETFLRKFGFFFRLSAIGYLTAAKGIAPSGRLVNPENMKSGQLFFRGSHILPLDRVAEKYAADKDGFLARGHELGGEAQGYGDASVSLLPLPRVPVVLILWVADDEFPARADLLFDSSCEFQLPIDVIWSIAMLSVLPML